MKPFALALCCVLLVMVAGCAPATQAPSPTPDFRVDYSAEVQFVPRQNRVEGEVAYEFAAPADINELVLYTPNSTVTSAHMDKEMLAVTEESPYVRIAFPTTLALAQKARVRVCFFTTIETNQYEWVQAEYMPMVCQWREGFVCPAAVDWAPYCPLATGQGNVTLHAPRNVEVVHSGQELQRTQDEQNQCLCYTLHAHQAPALAISPYYMHQAATVADTQVHLYAQNVTEVVWQRVQAIFHDTCEHWGNCPLPVVNIVLGPNNATSEGWAVCSKVDSQTMCRAIVAQWTTAAVAYDESPWIEASLASVGVWYYCTRYSPSTAAELWQQAKDDWRLWSITHEGADSERMDKPLAAYTQDSYRVLLQEKGLLMWGNLYQLLSHTLFEALGASRQADALSLDTIQAALHARTQGDYSAFLEAWLQGNVLPL